MVRSEAGLVARTLVSACLAVAAAIGIAMPAHAMRVSPMVNEITTQGAGSAARIEVENVNSAPLAYETRVFKIDYDDQGNLVETPADEDFLVFPPQGTLLPGARQVMRVQWVGDPAIAVSNAYYLSVQQLPIEFERGPADTVTAAVQVVYHMKALIAVAPEGARPNVEVVSVTPADVAVEAPAPSLEDPASEPPAPAMVPGLRITLRNTGNRYAMMGGVNWTVGGFTTDGQPVMFTIPREQMNAHVGAGYLAAVDGERTFELPVGVAFDPTKQFRVEFSD